MLAGGIEAWYTHDVSGITDVTGPIDVRRFVDNTGHQVFVVDDPTGSGGAFKYDGNTYTISAGDEYSLYIVEEQ